MHATHHHVGTNRLYWWLAVAALLLVALAFGLALLNPRRDRGAPARLQMFCAAGMRVPIERIARDYEAMYGVKVRLQYGGSNTLLSQIQLTRSGDIYLAADESYVEQARALGLVVERIPVARMRPVIAVARGNPAGIHGVDDLLRAQVRVALGNPDQAAIGRYTRRLLTASGQWEALAEHVTRRGVYKPTVPEVANDIVIGSVDAGIIWDATVRQYPELEAVRIAPLEAGTVDITMGIMSSAASPAGALRFARYIAARDGGLLHFAATGYEVIEGDPWVERPELTFYCGAVNRRAVEGIVRRFEQREGVTVNTVYNGCGILTGQMRTIRAKRDGRGFPDTYMACDVYYLDAVADWFEEGVAVSDTRIVIAVPEGNPAGITALADLGRPGMRVTVGQPEQCTIGVLTRKLLEAEGLHDRVMARVVARKPSSAMLVPDVVTGAADAALAYATDTRAEAGRIDTIAIDSPAARAVQPFSIARSSPHRQLGRRLFEAIADGRESFERAGFHFRLGGAADGAVTP